MDELDKRIVRAMQDDFPLVAEPYKALAEQLDIAEELLLQRVASLKADGRIRKMGAVLQHREVGYGANALCVWEVPAEALDDVAVSMSKHPYVSHCYDRNVQPDWPYNLYTMIHAHSREECEALAEELGRENGLHNKVMLFSVREWKKTTMRYFCEDDAAR